LSSVRSLRTRWSEMLTPEGPHDTPGASVVRPVVFGASDGLVSNLALIMGVGAASNDSHTVFIAGIAGLLAGAFSMAVGEYISVRSQREVLDYQVRLQRHQLREDPASEAAILRGIYQSRGLSAGEAEVLPHLEHEMAVRALRTSEGDEAKAAKILGVAKTTLHKKLKQG